MDNHCIALTNHGPSTLLGNKLRRREVGLAGSYYKIYMCVMVYMYYIKRQRILKRELFLKGIVINTSFRPWKIMSYS